MRTFCFLILAWTTIPIYLHAQIFPDYKERSVSGFSDSLYKQTYLISATEGSIDPDEYIVGPGDRIFISIGGFEEISLDLMINHEGNLYIPKVGGVNLKDIDLAEAKERIISAINKYYKNIDIFISLTDFRKIKVSLLGNVVRPFTTVLPANARLIDLIISSSGLNEDANYRTIIIKSRDEVERKYDLLSFLRFGDRKSNPLLHEGDMVIVDKIDKIVSISGQLKYPGTYEFVDGETVNDLINVSGSVLKKAKLDSIEIVRFDESGKIQKSEYYSFEQVKQDKILLKNQDHVIIREIPEYLIDKYVRIDGYVKYPGYYKILEDKTTLVDIISEAGGFIKNASLTEASLTRTMGTVEIDPEFERLRLIPRQDMTDDEYDYLKARSRQRQGKVVVDFLLLFKENNLSENVVLRRGDVIVIPEAKNYIIMLGQVVNPGNIIYNPNLTFEDYIELAGGYGWRALENDVRIIKANTGEWFFADDVDLLEPGDTIWIPEDPPGPKFWDLFITSLNVVGQVAAVIAATVAVIVATR